MKCGPQAQDCLKEGLARRNGPGSPPPSDPDITMLGGKPPPTDPSLRGWGPEEAWARPLDLGTRGPRPSSGLRGGLLPPPSWRTKSLGEDQSAWGNGPRSPPPAYVKIAVRLGGDSRPRRLGRGYAG